MTEATLDLNQALEALQTEVRALSARLSKLESIGLRPEASAAPAAKMEAAAPAGEPAQETISEELMLVISAAVATFLGERAHVRQVRLLRSDRWGLQGRVSVQASHSLYS